MTDRLRGIDVAHAVSAGFLAACLAGCAGRHAGVATPGAAPAWYMPSPADAARYPSQQYLVGRGACGPEVAPPERPDCALQRANEDVSLQVRARVSAVRERWCELDSSQRDQAGAISRAARSVCRSTLGGRSEATLELSNATPREQACDASYCYALVALPRAELARQVELGVASKRAQFTDLLARAAQVDLLSGMPLIGQAQLLAAPLDDASALEAAIHGAGPDGPSAAQQVLQARRARLQGASACLTADAAAGVSAERVFASASVLLSEQGLSRVLLGAACPADALRIEFAPLASGAPEPRRSDSAADLWTVSFAGRIRVSLADQGLAREQEVQGRGLARSADSARRDAEDRLAEAVRGAIAELVFGQTA
jgi:hypothetical protein